ncbi:hypothetical protein ACFC00_40165 [Streptomyces adustus]|uniref:hypothetical protein n=1 Tax=Streptomyces adustus TaxID=1609272 RepID=UPI0035D613BE
MGSGDKFRTDLHILNRSLDPVTYVTLYVRGADGGLYVAQSFELPPCTETVYDAEEMSLVPKGSWAPKEQVELALGDAFEYLAFFDSHGVGWKRSMTDLLKGRAGLPNAGIGGIVWLGEGRVKKAYVCGNGNGNGHG